MENEEGNVVVSPALRIGMAALGTTSGRLGRGVSRVLDAAEDALTERGVSKTVLKRARTAALYVGSFAAGLAGRPVVAAVLSSAESHARAAGDEERGVQVSGPTGIAGAA